MFIVWPVPIFLAVAAVLMAVVIAGRRLFPGTFRSRRTFWCPFRDTNVGAEFKQAVWDGRLLDVDSCTAFSPPHDVRCEKGCLLLGQFPAVKGEAATAR